MNEAEIAKSLADNLRAKQLAYDTNVTEQTATPPLDTGSNDGYVFDNPFDDFAMMRIYDFMQIPSHEQRKPETQKMMNAIVKWAYEVGGATEYFQVISAIRSVQQMTKRDSLYHVYEYARLHSQARKIDNELRSLYG